MLAHSALCHCGLKLQTRRRLCRKLDLSLCQVSNSFNLNTNMYWLIDWGIGNEHQHHWLITEWQLWDWNFKGSYLIFVQSFGACYHLITILLKNCKIIKFIELLCKVWIFLWKCKINISISIFQHPIMGFDTKYCCFISLHWYPIRQHEIL